MCHKLTFFFLPNTYHLFQHTRVAVARNMSVIMVIVFLVRYSVMEKTTALTIVTKNTVVRINSWARNYNDSLKLRKT